MSAFSVVMHALQLSRMQRMAGLQPWIPASTAMTDSKATYTRNDSFMYSGHNSDAQQQAAATSP
jgi:hypothetical protein